MNARLNIFIIVVFLLFGTSLCQAQETKTEGYLVPMCVYEGDTIPYIKDRKSTRLNSSHSV